MGILIIQEVFDPGKDPETGERPDPELVYWRVITAREAKKVTGLNMIVFPAAKKVAEKMSDFDIRWARNEWWGVEKNGNAFKQPRTWFFKDWQGAICFELRVRSFNLEPEKKENTVVGDFPSMRYAKLRAQKLAAKREGEIEWHEETDTYVTGSEGDLSWSITQVVRK